MNFHAKLLLLLVGVCFLDLIPIPITGLTLIYVLVQRPAWFIHTVHRIYGIEEKE